jgi:alkanesulfonate monooxygenase
MSGPVKTMHLGVLANPTGNHVASWLHPDAAADAAVNVRHYIDLAKTAERGLFDMIFLADSVATRDGDMEAVSRVAQYTAYLEPLTLLSAIAPSTEHVGLVATGNTTYGEPYHLARLFGSLDIISGGRAGWNIVTGASDRAALNFGRAAHPEHDQRYVQAREFTDVVLGLWDSWDDDAFPRDVASGRYFDPAKRHVLDHRGEYYAVRGPLNLPRPVQGYPVLLQAGSSDAGRAFAAEYGEAIFTAHITLAEAQSFYADLKARAARGGRNPDHVVILPGFSPLVGSTEAEAKEKFDYLQSLIHPEVLIATLSMALGGTDLAGYDLDAPVPDLAPPNTMQGAFHTTMALAREEKLTLRQLAVRVSAGRQRAFLAGTPKQIADHMEQWFREGAADGFNIIAPYFPGAFEEFVDEVVPELQRRGLFRTEYEGTTLRENLGLPRPAGRYQRA